MRTSVDVHNFLVERDVPHEVLPVRGRLRSPERLAAVLEIPPGEVGKVVVFEGSSGAVAVVVPAGQVPDTTRVRKVADSPDLEPAPDDRTAALTEFLPEALPPVGLPDGVQLILDRSLARDAVLYFAGGEAHAVLKIRGKDLVRAAGAKVARIAARGE